MSFVLCIITYFTLLFLDLIFVFFLFYCKIKLKNHEIFVGRKNDRIVLFFILQYLSLSIHLPIHFYTWHLLYTCTHIFKFSILTKSNVSLFYRNKHLKKRIFTRTRIQTHRIKKMGGIKCIEPQNRSAK